MSVFLRGTLLAVALLWTAPAISQTSFKGLDTTTTPKKKKKKGTTTKRKTRPSKPAPQAKPPEEPPKPSAPAEEATSLKPEGPPAPTVAPPPTLPQKPKPPAPTLTFEAVDVSGKTAERQRLDVAIKQFNDQQLELSALTSYELMRDPKMLGLQLDAQYVLAKSLYRLGLYHSALMEFSKILTKGPQTKFFTNGLEWLFFISHKTTNETVILDEIAKYANAEFPARFRSEFHYLLARYHFVRGRALDQLDRKVEANRSFDQVKAQALTVPKGDPFYARAKYLEGLSYFREDKFDTAIEAMKEVVRNTRPGGEKSELQAKQDKDARELAFMQLARTHYGHRQNRNAIYYYNLVERGGKQWLEALFEASWAHYRVGQYEQALGNLVTLSSPFFRDEYFPEVPILKAVIYYENCRYRESRTALEDFERIYLPVQEHLQQLLQRELDTSDYYRILNDIQKKNRTGAQKSPTDIILERILKLALTDKDLKSTNDSILELEAEIDAIGKRRDTFRYSELAKNLIDGLKLSREALVKRAGIMTKGKLELEKGELTRLLGNGLRIKFETTTKEKEFLEEQLRAGGRAEIVKKYRYSAAVRDDQLYWPFEGEYWRDELGTYHYTLTKGCIERQAVGAQ